MTSMFASTVTIAQARAFCLVDAERSYRRAAEAAGDGATPTQVKRLVERFAEALDLPLRMLLEVDHRGRIEVTDRAKELLPTARRLVEAAAVLHGGEEQVRVGGYPSVIGRIVAALPELLDPEAGVRFHDVRDVSRADGGRALVEGTRAGVYDLAIAPAGLSISDVVSHELYRWSLRCVCGDEGDDAIVAAPVGPANLRGKRLALAPAGHRSRQLIEEAFVAAGETLLPAIETSSHELMWDFAMSGRGYAAIMPDDSFGQRELLGKEGRPAPAFTHPGGSPLGGTYCVYYRSSGAVAPRLTQLVERLVRAFA